MATDGYGLQNDAAARGKIQSANWNLAMDAIQVIGEVFGILGGEGFVAASDFNASGVGSTKFVDVTAGYGIILKDGVYVAIHQPDAQTGLAIVGTTASPQTNYGYIDSDGVCTVVQNPVNAPADSMLAWTCTCTDTGASAIDQLPDGRLNLLSILAARVSDDDEQSGYLSSKVVAGTNVTATVLNNGENETLSIAAPNLVSDLGDTLTGALLWSMAAAGDKILRGQVSGDAKDRIYIKASGEIGFGPGGSTDPDCIFIRGSAGLIQSSDTGLQLRRTTGTDIAFSAKATADSGVRVSLTANGVYTFGDGAGANDVTLYRAAANILRTDDSFANGVASPAQITANQNNYAFGAGRYQRLSTDASRNITGIVATVDGDERVISNIGAQNLVLTNQDAASTAANRIITGTGASVTIAADTSRIIWYDGTTARWRLV